SRPGDRRRPGRCAHRELPPGARSLSNRGAMRRASNAPLHPLSPSARAVSARDAAWLTGSLAVAVLPHLARSPWWLVALALCLYGWRVYFIVTRTALPSRWLLLAVALVGILGVWVDQRTLFGRGAGVMLLVLFSGLKLMEV